MPVLALQLEDGFPDEIGMMAGWKFVLCEYCDGGSGSQRSCNSFDFKERKRGKRKKRRETGKKKKKKRERERERERERRRHSTHYTFMIWPFFDDSIGRYAGNQVIRDNYPQNVVELLVLISPTPTCVASYIIAQFPCTPWPCSSQVPTCPTCVKATP